MIKTLATAYLRNGARSLVLWLPPSATPLLGERVANFLEKSAGLAAELTILHNGVAALNRVSVEEAIRELTAVATLRCNETEIDRLGLKAEACLYLAVTILQGLGQLDEAVFWWRERRRLVEIITKHHGGNDSSVEVFDDFWPSHIGHTALLGIYVKRNLLGGEPYRRFYLICPIDRGQGNRCLVNYWRGYFTLIDGPEQLPFFPRYTRYSAKRIYLEPLLDGSDSYFWQAYAEITRLWKQHGFGPLLALSDDDLRQGRATLESLGLPGSAWYVCLHVRSAGYKNIHDDLQDTLNADIHSYDLAINVIVERGGWVIRMGDPSMPGLPPMKNVVDYAHSRYKSEAGDVFLCGTCRFYVGTSSGLAYVPSLFGVRSVLTNWFPVGTRPLDGDDLFIPKLHRYQADDEHVPFAEALAPPVGHIHARPTLKALGISVRDNTREELRDIVVEMIERLDGTFATATDDEQLQARFDAVALACRSYGNARIGRNFIRQHRALLPPQAATYQIL